MLIKRWAGSAVVGGVAVSEAGAVCEAALDRSGAGSFQIRKVDLDADSSRERFEDHLTPMRSQRRAGRQGSIAAAVR